MSSIGKKCRFKTITKGLICFWVTICANMHINDFRNNGRGKIQDIILHCYELQKLEAKGFAIGSLESECQ